jgi:hypothetical protein
MQMAADRPEKILAAPVQAVFGLGIDAGLDEVFSCQVGIEMLGDPVKRMEIAQATFALLDIRLDPVTGGAGALVALVALIELRRDELSVSA